MIMNGNMIKRISLYVLGLFVMTVGIAFSFRSDLGSSPVSSIPYSMMHVWAIEVGFATILFHIALVILQFLILRKNFKAKILLQVVAGVLFGYSTTLQCIWFHLYRNLQVLLETLYFWESVLWFWHLEYFYTFRPILFSLQVKV